MNQTVVLRDVLNSDLPIFYEQQLDPVATEMADFPSRERDAFMAHWAKIMANESGVLRTIVCDGQVAGNIVCWVVDDGREVGYWLGREFWGKGIATQALREFLVVVKERPLWGYTAGHNVGSQRVLEKCGFERTDRATDHGGILFQLR